MHTDEIRSIPLFDEVPRARRAELAMIADQVTVPAGKVLARQGELAHEFFVIVSGVVAFVRDGAVIDVLGPGEFFGEIALLSDPHRTATVVAVSKVDLVVIARRDFRTMLARFPDLASTILTAASQRVVEALREAQVA